MSENTTPLKTLSVFDRYQEIVSYSRDFGRVQIRKSLYINTLDSSLKKYGGIGIWTAVLIISFIVLLISNSLPSTYSNLIKTVSGTFICYFSCIFGLGGVYADFYILLHGRSTEETVFLKISKKVVNKITVNFLFSFVIIFSIVSSLAWPHVAKVFLACFGNIAVLAGILSGITWTWKNLNDYYRIISATLGKKSVIIRDTEELVRDLFIKLLRLKESQERLHHLAKLAENDLRRAEVRLEIANISIAGFAILFSILFSDQLKVAFFALIDIIINFIQLFSLAASELLTITTELQVISLYGISLAMWIYLGNIILGLLFLIIRSFLSVYFSYYRPAHALYQALLIIDDNP